MSDLWFSPTGSCLRIVAPINGFAARLLNERIGDTGSAVLCSVKTYSGMNMMRLWEQCFNLPKSSFFAIFQRLYLAGWYIYI